LRDDIVGASFRIEADKIAWSVEGGEPTIAILMHAHGGADMLMAMPLGRNLEAARVPGDAVVGADHSILLDAEHVLDRPADIGHERRAGEKPQPIERMFCRLKDFRRIATRHDKLGRNFLAGVLIAEALGPIESGP
jgi:transposase